MYSETGELKLSKQISNHHWIFLDQCQTADKKQDQVWGCKMIPLSLLFNILQWQDLCICVTWPSLFIWRRQKHRIRNTMTPNQWGIRRNNDVLLRHWLGRWEPGRRRDARDKGTSNSTPPLGCGLACGTCKTWRGWMVPGLGDRRQTRTAGVEVKRPEEPRGGWRTSTESIIIHPDHGSKLIGFSTM